jgi:NADH-quinone oxidoreductase subunit G
VNDEKRVKSVLIRQGKDQNLEPVSDEKLISSVDQSFSKTKTVIGIGSPRASIESNYALMSLVGRENFYQGISKKEFLLTRTVLEFMQQSGVLTPSLKQIEKADAILVMGEDISNTAPMIALALRQATRNVPGEEAKKKGIPLWNDAPVREWAQDNRSPLFVVTPFSDSLDEIAEGVFRASPPDISHFGLEVVKEIGKQAQDAKSEKEDIQMFAGRVALSLKNARNPLIISGVTCGDETTVHAALNIAGALLSAGTKVMLSMILPECNSLGLSLLGDKSLEDLLSLVENKEIDTLVVLENDLYRRANEDSVNELVYKSRQIIVLDHLVNRTTGNADIVLPAATFAESEGTLVNNEGRAQRYYKAINPEAPVRESWRWIAEFIKVRDGNRALSWHCLDDIVESLANELQVFSKLKKYMPDADFRMLNARIPRQTIRYSGRTAISADVSVREPGLSQDPDSPLAFSMEGQQEYPPSSLVPFYWSPGWNSVQALYNYLDDNGSLKGGNPGIRLIEPSGTGKRAYAVQVTHNQKVSKDELMIIPVYRIFGSDELSSVGRSIAQRIEQPFILMNQKDADIFSLIEGDIVQLELLKIRLTLKVKIGNSFHQGMAGVSVNLPGMPFIDIPGSGKFHKL